MCRSVSVLAAALRAQTSGTMSAQQGESQPGSAESHTFGDTHTAAIHYPQSYYSTLQTPFSPISHASLYCGAAPDFMGTGPEWRLRITAAHIVNQTAATHKNSIENVNAIDGACMQDLELPHIIKSRCPLGPTILLFESTE